MRYRVRVKASYRWPRARVAGQEFTKRGEMLAQGYINDEIRASPLLEIDPVAEPEVDATDAARALAAEHGVDLATVPGSGEDGRVLVDDVREVLDVS
jgi:pyruvate/2-oxoglutarate dehydrogenase complex dihydrolipoamide acyltransferase (E2) component